MKDRIVESFRHKLKYQVKQAGLTATHLDAYAPSRHPNLVFDEIAFSYDPDGYPYKPGLPRNVLYAGVTNHHCELKSDGSLRSFYHEMGESLQGGFFIRVLISKPLIWSGKTLERVENQVAKLITDIANKKHKVSARVSAYGLAINPRLVVLNKR